MKLFFISVLKLLKAIKHRFAATKLTLPKYFNLNKNVPESESDSEEEDEISRIKQRSLTPITRVPQQSVYKIKPEITRQPTRHDSLRLSAEDSEMSAIFRSSLATSSVPVTASTSIVSAVSSTRVVTPSISLDRPMTPAMRRVLNESIPQSDRSATPFQNQNGRVQCQGITGKGLQCRNAAFAGFTKCRLHNN